mmetsp:Transcript_43866/g.132778  ORF Transcript_43866/g.132778 Transcript_43866/m.132778 type:complete len:637 (+) Transcript_43866:42-1952(+)
MVSNHKLVCARAARDEFAEDYRRGIRDYRLARGYAASCGRELQAQLPEDLPLLVLKQLRDPAVVQLAWDGVITLDNKDARTRETPFRVMARKRPLLPSEREARLYDTLSTEGANNAVVVHDGRVHRDGRTLYMVHSRFCLDRIFGASESNDTVYTDAAQPLLHAAAAGGRATLVLFGQTGTGKTYTAQGVLDHLAEEAFACGVGGDSGVSIMCYEIAGTHGGKEAVFDLLAARAPVKCLTGEDGQVHVRGARATRCGGAAELQRALAAAFAWRSSESTERNEASSRSHAIIELQFAAPGGGGPGAGSAGGVLRVVDLAGSERNFETQMHTRKMAERGGHINYSLLMLKECARIMHRNRKRRAEGRAEELQHVPFRSSRLTLLLQSCFTDEAHRTVVVATLSPSPVDVEHSLNSLQHVGMMRASQSSDGAGSAAQASSNQGGEATFGKVEGRGHGLHSKLQDARAAQLKLHAFGMVTGVGGSVMKRYEPENVKTEAFIDPRWHREMNVAAERDLWVLREADAEAVQVLTEGHEEQWEARKSHDIVRWDARAVRAFVQGLGLPGEARLPSTMTGAQLCRLGRRGIAALCGDEATAEALHAALLRERAAAREAGMSNVERNAKMTALGANKVHVVLDAE